MIDLLHLLADEAEPIMRRYFLQLTEADVHMKTRMDPVTIADGAIERRIVDMITSRYPDHTVLAEEFNHTSCREGPLWIIDPLDGTTNYLHGLPYVCTSIAYLEDGIVQAAVVAAPFVNERFSATKGGGALLNGNPIRVHDEAELQRSLLCTGYADLRKHGDDTNLRVWNRLAPRCAGIRRMGAAALDLCWVAAGRFDGFWERELCPWDVAAASLIITEAGGRVRNLGADDFDPFDGSLVAAGPSLVNVLHDLVVNEVEGYDGEDGITTVADLRTIMESFINERAWNKYHTPKNLASSIAIEAAELMEIFQWLDPQEAGRITENPEQLNHAAEELSDILAYVLSLSSSLEIDLAAAFRRKMAKNSQKYPADEFRGQWTPARKRN